jgi:uncharacterized protein (DUF3084 family)
MVLTNAQLIAENRDLKSKVDEMSSTNAQLIAELNEEANHAKSIYTEHKKLMSYNRKLISENNALRERVNKSIYAHHEILKCHFNTLIFRYKKLKEKLKMVLIEGCATVGDDICLRAKKERLAEEVEFLP